MLDLFHVIYPQRVIFFFQIYAFSIGLHSDAHEVIFFIFDLLVETIIEGNRVTNNKKCFNHYFEQ